MKNNQVIRAVGIGAVVAILVARLVTVGNGAVTAFGYRAAPFSLSVLAIIVLALPETIDTLPFGPSKK